MATAKTKNTPAMARTKPEDHRLGLVLGDEAQADRRADEQGRQKQEQADVARLVRPGQRRRGRRFSHLRHRRLCPSFSKAYDARRLSRKT
jgi:hypothetical protein